MGILHRRILGVETNRDAVRAELPPEGADLDAAWWAAYLSYDAVRGPADDASDTARALDPAAGDRTWFAVLRQDAERRAARRETDADGCYQCVADLINDLLIDMAACEATNAYEFLKSEACPHSWDEALALAPPSRWTFGSGLAEGLDSLANFHIAEGAVRDRLLALILIKRAKAAEAFGAGTYSDLLMAESLARRAELDAFDGDDECRWN